MIFTFKDETVVLDNIQKPDPAGLVKISEPSTSSIYDFSCKPNSLPLHRERKDAA